MSIIMLRIKQHGLFKAIQPDHSLDLERTQGCTNFHKLHFCFKFHKITSHFSSDFDHVVDTMMSSTSCWQIVRSRDYILHILFMK